jgi:uncharacterized RDD family membrane protein YckC
MSCSNCGEPTPDEATQCPSCGLPLASGSQAPQPSWDPPVATGWDPPLAEGSWGSAPGGSSPPGGNEGWGGPLGGPGQTPWGAPGAPYTPYPSYPSGWNDPAVEPSARLAGWWRRVGATLIDIIIIVVAARVIEALTDRVVYTIFILLASLVYTSVLLVTHGQTVGMMAVGTKCVTESSGSYLTYGPAIGRWFVAELLAITGIGGLLDILWPLWDGKNQTLHDKAVHTLVVLTR